MLLQLFMSELESNSTVEEGGVSPSPTLLPPPPPPSHTSSQPTDVSTSVECTDPSGLDDRLLMAFTDIEGLLQDTNLAGPAPVLGLGIESPIENGMESDLFFGFSECVTTATSPYSSSDCSDVAINFSDAFCPSSSPDDGQVSPLFSQELVVKHDHSYAASAEIETEEVPTCRKRSAIDAAEQTPEAKKTRTIVKDKRYFERRNKNNVASQNSRAKKRARIKDMLSRMQELEEQNAGLRAEVEQMEAEAEQLKKKLIDRLAQ